MQLSGGRIKLIIDVPNTIYEGCKRRCAEKKSRIAEFVIAKGVPYEERPIGHWIRGREICREMMGNCIEHIEYKDFTCSECGLVLDNLLYYADGSPFYKFCPKCGAEMEGEK